MNERKIVDSSEHVSDLALYEFDKPTSETRRIEQTETEKKVMIYCELITAFISTFLVRAMCMCNVCIEKCVA